MNNESVKLRGLKGRWYVIDEIIISGTGFYLFESEEDGEDVPAVLTDDNYNVIDAHCRSGIRVALHDNGLWF